MDENMDHEAYKLMIEALKKMKQDDDFMRQRREVKLWSEIDVEISLEQALSRLTKEELTGIRQQLELKNLSALNKQQLQRELVVRIIEKAGEIFHLFDSERYKLVKAIVANGGFIADFSLETDQIEHLRLLGIIFSGISRGKRVLVMPQEVCAEFNRLDPLQYQRIIRRNTEWIRITQGMLNYYGVLTHKQLSDLLARYFSEKLDVCTQLDLLHEAVSYYGEMRPDLYGYANIRVWDTKRVREEQEARSELGFYPFSKEQLYKAGAPGFVDRNFAYQDLVDFITDNFEISRNEADAMVEECVYAIKIEESLSDIMEYLQSYLDLNTLEITKIITDKLVSLMNNTRRWSLKGYTPTELRPHEEETPREHKPNRAADVIDFQTRRKIGRNDPCPCGSGKKFKHCCGQ